MFILGASVFNVEISCVKKRGFANLQSVQWWVPISTKGSPAPKSSKGSGANITTNVQALHTCTASTRKGDVCVQLSKPWQDLFVYDDNVLDCLDKLCTYSNYIHRLLTFLEVFSQNLTSFALPKAPFFDFLGFALTFRSPTQWKVQLWHEMWLVICFASLLKFCCQISTSKKYGYIWILEPI